MIQPVYLCRLKRSEETNAAMSFDKETDVEHLCKAIYDNGEQYMDGTAAISFSALKMVRFFSIACHILYTNY